MLLIATRLFTKTSFDLLKLCFFNDDFSMHRFWMLVVLHPNAVAVPCITLQAVPDAWHVLSIIVSS